MPQDPTGKVQRIQGPSGAIYEFSHEPTQEEWDQLEAYDKTVKPIKATPTGNGSMLRPVAGMAGVPKPKVRDAPPEPIKVDTEALTRSVQRGMRKAARPQAVTVPTDAVTTERLSNPQNYRPNQKPVTTGADFSLAGITDSINRIVAAPTVARHALQSGISQAVGGEPIDESVYQNDVISRVGSTALDYATYLLPGPSSIPGLKAIGLLSKIASIGQILGAAQLAQIAVHAAEVGVPKATDDLWEEASPLAKGINPEDRLLRAVTFFYGAKHILGKAAAVKFAVDHGMSIKDAKLSLELAKQQAKTGVNTTAPEVSNKPKITGVERPAPILGQSRGPTVTPKPTTESTVRPKQTSTVQPSAQPEPVAAAPKPAEPVVKPTATPKAKPAGLEALTDDALAAQLKKAESDLFNDDPAVSGPASARRKQLAAEVARRQSLPKAEPVVEAKPKTKAKPTKTTQNEFTYFHKTPKENVEAILSNGFSPSESGELGPGVYLANDANSVSAKKFDGQETVAAKVKGRFFDEDSPLGLFQTKLFQSLPDAQRSAMIRDARGKGDWSSTHEFLKSQGYDGIRRFTDGKPDGVLVFDAKNVTPKPAPAAPVEAAQPAKPATPVKTPKETAKPTETGNAVSTEEAAKPETFNVTRQNPVSRVDLDKPIVGPTGAKLTSYQWSWKNDLKWSEGKQEFVEARVSDWESSIQNKETGKDVVHQFYVQMPNGSTQIVSLETAAKLLGFGDNTLSSTASSLKTYAKSSMRRSAIADKLAKVDRATADAQSKPIEQYTTRDATPDDGPIVYKNGYKIIESEGYRESFNPKTLNDEQRAVKNLKTKIINERVKAQTGVDNYSISRMRKELIDLDNRLSKSKVTLAATRATSEPTPKTTPKETPNEQTNQVRQTGQEANSAGSNGPESTSGVNRTQEARQGGVPTESGGWPKKSQLIAPDFKKAPAPVEPPTITYPKRLAKKVEATVEAVAPKEQTKPSASVKPAEAAASTETPKETVTPAKAKQKAPWEMTPEEYNFARKSSLDLIVDAQKRGGVDTPNSSHTSTVVKAMVKGLDVPDDVALDVLRSTGGQQWLAGREGTLPPKYKALWDRVKAEESKERDIGNQAHNAYKAFRAKGEETTSHNFMRSVTSKAYLDRIRADAGDAYALMGDEAKKRFDDRWLDAHKRVVTDALKEGKPVPQNVIDEYVSNGGKLPETATPLTEKQQAKANLEQSGKKVKTASDNASRRARGRQAGSFVPLDPEYMAALVDHAKNWVAYGKASAKEWLEGLRKQEGDEAADEVAPHLDEIWAKAGGKVDGIVKPPEAQSEKITGAGETVRTGENPGKTVADSVNTLYHGTTSAFESFDSSKSRRGGLTWFTPDQEFANRFADIHSPRSIGESPRIIKYNQRDGVKILSSDDKGFIDHAIKNWPWVESPDEPGVLFLDSKFASEQFDPNHFDDLFSALTLNELKALGKEGDFRIAESPEFVKYAKANGYEGVSAIENGHKTIGLFDPSKSGEVAVNRTETPKPTQGAKPTPLTGTLESVVTGDKIKAGEATTPKKRVRASETETNTSKKQPEKFASSNASTNATREAVGLLDAEKLGKQTRAKIDEQTDKANHSADAIDAHAASINQAARSGKEVPATTTSMQSAMNKRAAESANTVMRALDDLSKVEPGTPEAQRLIAERDIAAARVDDLSQALNYSGTATATTLGSRNFAIRDDYTPAGLYRRFVMARGGKLTAELEAKVKAMGHEIEVRQKAYDEAVAAHQETQNKLAESENKRADAEQRATEAAAVDRANQIRRDYESRSQGRKVNKADVRLRQKAAFEQGMKALRGQTSNLGPGQALSDVAPHVMEFAKASLEGSKLTLLEASDKIATEWNAMVAEAGYNEDHKITTRDVVTVLAGKVKRNPTEARVKSDLQKFKDEARKVLADEIKTQQAKVKAAETIEREAQLSVDRAEKEKVIASEFAERKAKQAEAKADADRAREDFRQAMKAYRAQEKADRVAAGNQSRELKKQAAAEAKAARKAYADYLNKSGLAERARLMNQQQRLEAKLKQVGPNPKTAKPPLTDPEAIRIKGEIDAINAKLREANRQAPTATGMDQVSRMQRQRNLLQKRLEAIGPEKPKNGQPLTNPEAIQIRNEIDAIKRKLAQDAKDRKAAFDDMTKRDRVQKRIDALQSALDFVGPKPPKKPNVMDDPAVRDLKIKLEAKKNQALQEERQIKSEAQFHNLTKGEKVAAYIRDVLGIPRTIKASLDGSAPLRQNIFFSLTRPITSAKSLPDMFKAMYSKEGAAEVAGYVRSREHFELALASKLHLDGINAPQGGEMFPSQYLTKNPVIRGKTYPNPIGGSERGYGSYLSRVRMDVFSDLVESMGGASKITKKEADMIAEYINTATGVGTGKFAELAKGLPAQPLFAPGFLVSRVKLATGTPFWNAVLNKNAALAGRIAGDYLKFAAAVTTLAVISKAILDPEPDKPFNGLNLNPRDPMFLKAKFGDRTMDLSAGTAQPVKVLAQMIPDISATAKGKKVDWGMTLGRFFEGKLAPIPGTTYAIMKGEAFGKSYDLSTTEGKLNVASNLSEPLYINSLREIAIDDSIPDIQKAFILSVGYLGLDSNETIKPKDERRSRSRGTRRRRDPRTQ